MRIRCPSCAWARLDDEAPRGERGERHAGRLDVGERAGLARHRERRHDGVLRVRPARAGEGHHSEHLGARGERMRLVGGAHDHPAEVVAERRGELLDRARDPAAGTCLRVDRVDARGDDPHEQFAQHRRGCGGGGLAERFCGPGRVEHDRAHLFGDLVRTRLAVGGVARQRSGRGRCGEGRRTGRAEAAQAIRRHGRPSGSESTAPAGCPGAPSQPCDCLRRVTPVLPGREGSAPPGRHRAAGERRRREELRSRARAAAG